MARLIKGVVVGVALGGFSISAFLAHNMGCDAERFFGELRGPLFTGFLTLGSFLLSVTTWIIVRLHEGMYKNSKYIERYEKLRLLNPKKVGHILDPLANLSEFLIWSVIACLGTSVVQLLAAAYPSHSFTVIAFGCVGAALSLVGVSWWAIRRNLRDYFSCLREEANERST